MLEIIGLILLSAFTVSCLWYLHKNPPVVLDGSTVLHYHIISAHVNYKYKKDSE